MLTTLMSFLAVWFLISIPASLIIGAILARRDAPAPQTTLPVARDRHITLPAPDNRAYDSLN
ncbi:MAG: hypothetical protein SF123_21620 [Chloroflexota bacterium]|nr:hypothetical protein [Chloroflexota bacterium]